MATSVYVMMVSGETSWMILNGDPVQRSTPSSHAAPARRIAALANRLRQLEPESLVTTAPNSRDLGADSHRLPGAIRGSARPEPAESSLSITSSRDSSFGATARNSS